MDWDERVPDCQIDLQCARFGRHMNAYMNANLDDLDVHFCRAVRQLFIPSEYRINSWSEKIFHAWCNIHDYNGELCLFGCSSSNKSHSMGLVALLDWMAAPHDTTTFFASTTLRALERRSWASIVSFYQTLKRKGLPAYHMKSKTAIINTEDKALEEQGVYSPESFKSGVFGIAVMSGTVQDAVSNIIGVHQNRVPEGATESPGGVRVIVDEAQGTKEAIINATSNLAIGTPDFRLVLMGNPMEFEDPLGVRAEPEHGWDSVTMDEEDWRTRTGGMAIHFDGTKSPACTEENGEEDYPFLIGPKHIKTVLRQCHGNDKHPDYLSMVRGWISHSADSNVLMPKSTQRSYGMYDEPIGWRHDPFVVMALDPSFSSGGDDAIIMVAEAGTEKDGVFRIVFHPDPIIIPIQDSKVDPPIHQILRATWSELQRWGVDTRFLVVDETATQTVGSSLFLMAPPGIADSAAPPLLFNGNTSPSDKHISEHDKRKGVDVFSTCTTEAWFWVEAFGRFGQIRNFPPKAGSQFSSRRVEQSASRRRGSISLETKKKLKDRGLPSPNEADCCAMIVHLIRERMGATPGDFKHNTLRNWHNFSGEVLTGFQQDSMKSLLELQDHLDDETNQYLGDDDEW